MSCGEKVSHYTRIKEEQVSEEMATGTTIRWLISEQDGAKNFYMRMFYMRPNAHIKSHFHPWEHEIFILEGKGKVRIGSNTYDVSEGYIVYIPPNVEHEYWSGDEGLRFLCIIPSSPTVEKTSKPIKC